MSTGPVAGRAKLADVARAANVSLATASRVLNQPAIVRRDVRERVLDAVRALSYTPDRTAKALSSGRSFIVGAVVPTLGNAIFADGVEALQDRLGEQGYTLLLSNSQYDPEKELRQVRALLEHGVDGLVLVGDSFAPGMVPLIRQHATPCVTTYGIESKHGFSSVGIDNRAATYQLTQYLLELGHRDFGILSNTALPNDRSQARLEGVLAALTNAGVSVPDNCIIKVAKPTMSSGRAGLQDLLGRNRAITAVVCTTDALGVGALAEARGLGIDVPGSLSISGFDDVEIAGQADPPLTTIKVPATQIGRLAAEHLVRAIQGEELAMSTRFAAEMVIRGSTAIARRRQVSAARGLRNASAPSTG